MKEHHRIGTRQSRLNRGRSSSGWLAGSPRRIEVEILNGVESQDVPVRIGQPLPVAFMLMSGQVYVAGTAARCHADLWLELCDSGVAKVEEVADLGFWQDGTYYSKGRPPG